MILCFIPAILNIISVTMFYVQIKDKPKLLQYFYNLQISQKYVLLKGGVLKIID